MMTWNPQANDLFLKARELRSPRERQEYLEQACSGDAALRAEVESLLEASARAGSFLESPAPAPNLTATVDEAPMQETPGTVIGPYKLLQQIGEGGFGVVFMAEQQEPIRRKVALKILKPGMDTRQVVARFEAERQALAIMDHPNIARVFDGGATATGRPYFVMELVRGIPITAFCDQTQMPIRQRLELFVGVCQAVQHAHQKGIIHRDLKPSNVLVTLHDGTPVGKVIDFGIAKATGQQLTDKTLFTHFASMVGTPLYMSPEQAGMSGLDVDTRSDVYSLGVLLYELLAGTTPFDKERLKSVDYDEMRRIIREEEPPRPSTRLNTIGQASTTISTQRQSDPRRLSQLFRGELDWIVMKALEKDRNRRYETATGFAADVRRYLASEPVQAVPPSIGYRLLKFARRNRGRLLALGALGVAVLVAGAGIGWALRDRDARQAEAERERAGRLARTQQAVDQAVDQAIRHRDELHAELRDKGTRALLNQPARWLFQIKTAQSELERGRALAGGSDGPLDAKRRGQMQNLAQALANDEADYRLALRLEKIREYSSVEVEGEFDNAAAAKQYSKALKEGGLAVSPGQEAELAAQIEQSPIRDQLLATLDDWAYIAWVIGQHDVQQRLLQVARRVDPDAEWKDQVRDPSRWKDPEALKALAARKGADPAALARLSPQMLALLGRLLPRDEAEKWLRQAQALHPTDYWLNYHLAYKVGPISPPRAECYVRAMLAIRPTSVGAWASLGDVLFAQGDWPQAFAAYSKALEINPNDGEAYRRRASALKAQGKVKEAVAAYENALEVDRNNPVVHLSYGALLCDELRDYDAALARFNRAIELKPNYPQAYRNRGEALMRKGLADKAMADIRTALRLRPHYPEAYISLGDVLQMKGDSKRAITAYRTAIKLDPKNNGAHHNLGVAFYKGGSYNEAIVEFREAIWIQPKAPLHHHCLGHALRQKKLFDKALEAYGEALRLDPRRAKVWVDIGLTHELQGNYDPAIAAYHRAAELKPNNSNTYKMARDRLASVSNSLAWLLATSPDPKRRNPSCAVKHATRAVELSPRNPNYWNTLGVAHYRTGDWNATAAALGKSMQLRNGGDSFDWFILALAHWQLANKGEARNWYDKAVEWMDKNRPNDEQLRRFRAEAATLLEVRKKMD